MPYQRVKDGAAVLDSEALDERGALRDGYALSFSMAMMDGNKVVRVRHMADATPATLRDAAGKPTRLYDATSGATLQLNDHLIAAIENEARREGMAVNRYVADVLRYSPAPTTTR